MINPSDFWLGVILGATAAYAIPALIADAIRDFKERSK